MQDQNIRELFGLRISRLIAEHDLTQAIFAKSVGVSQGAVSGWCSGAIPRADQLQSIAAFFQVSMEWLLSGQDAEPSGKGGPGNAPMFSSGLGAAARIAKATSMEEEAKDYRNLAAKLQKRVDKLNGSIADLIKQAEWCDDFAKSVLEYDEDEEDFS